MKLSFYKVNCGRITLEYSVTLQMHIILRVVIWMSGSTKHSCISYSKEIETDQYLEAIYLFISFELNIPPPTFLVYGRHVHLPLNSTNTKSSLYPESYDMNSNKTDSGIYKC